MNSVFTPQQPTQFLKRPVPPARDNNFEFYTLVVLLFVLYSRVFDFFPVPMAAMSTFIVSIAAVVFSGRLTQLFHPRISKLWIMLTAWLALSAAMSIWRAGSLQALIAWLKTLSVYFITIGLITTIDQCYRSVRTLAWAIGVLAVLSFLYGDSTNGRFFLDAGKFQGPNELAQVLLFGIPFVWVIFLRSPRISANRLTVLGLMLILISILLRTASRGAMITAGVMALVALASKPSKTKLIVFVGGGLVILIGGMALSETARSRYLTFFDASVDPDESRQTVAMQEIATASANQRWELLLESLRMTAAHPLLGVGLGMFAEARERESRSEGTHVPFLVTHNTYTEFSTEAGIPAAIIFIVILIASYRTAGRVERLAAKQPTKRLQDVAAMAVALKFSVLSFGVSALFISVAYQSISVTLAGLAVALECAFKAELDAQAPNPTQIAPVAAPSKPRQSIAPPARGLRSRLRKTRLTGSQLR